MCLDRGADSIREAGSTAAATGGGAGEDAAGSQGAWQVGPNAVHQVQWHCAVCSGQLKEENVCSCDCIVTRIQCLVIQA